MFYGNFLRKHAAAYMPRSFTKHMICSILGDVARRGTLVVFFPVDDLSYSMEKLVEDRDRFCACLGCVRVGPLLRHFAGRGCTQKVVFFLPK